MGMKEFLKRKFTQGVAELAASGRQGHKELANALAWGPPPVEEPGTMGNPVAMEVYEQKHPEGDYPSHLARQAEQQKPDKQQQKQREMGD